jgi:hypothetical protein
MIKQIVVDITNDLRDYRFVGEEAESLGNRLDSVRDILEEVQSPWAKRYWSQVLDQLLFQWRSLPALHDSHARMTMIPKWTIDYDYYQYENTVDGYDFTDKVFDQIFRTSLDESWNRAREARLARAQF